MRFPQVTGYLIRFLLQLETCSSPYWTLNNWPGWIQGHPKGQKASGSSRCPSVSRSTAATRAASAWSHHPRRSPLAGGGGEEGGGEREEGRVGGLNLGGWRKLISNTPHGGMGRKRRLKTPPTSKNTHILTWSLPHYICFLPISWVNTAQLKIVTGKELSREEKEKWNHLMAKCHYLR